MTNHKLPNYIFCSAPTTFLTERINASTTTSVIGIPGMGISLFLKHLTTLPLGKMIYIDVFGLPSLTPTELFKTLLTKLDGTNPPQTETDPIADCKSLLENLIKKEKVIICFGGFDQLKDHFNQDFFHQLRSLRNVDQQKIVFIFGICRRIESLISEDLMDTDLHMLSSTYYLQPYSPDDLKRLLSIYGSPADLENEDLEKFLHLSGGHFQLLQLLLRSERPHNPADDPFIKLAFHNIYQYVTHSQKKNIAKIAQTGICDGTDEYLLKVGLVVKKEERYELFSPLFAEYVLKQKPKKLPAKEAQLLALLQKNSGKLVSKDTIFETVWENDTDNASDWALDALIYRLRKNPSFIAEGFRIENHKKVGYRLLGE